MSPHCVWIITVGGGVGDTKTPVKFPNIVKLTELGKYVFLLNFPSISVHGVSAREIFKTVFMWVWLYDHIKTCPLQL